MPTGGAYHNTDPVLINYLIRLAIEKRATGGTQGINDALAKLVAAVHAARARGSLTSRRAFT